ncbi:NAD(P)-binding domain-containing protein [Streptomyces sp. L7]
MDTSIAVVGGTGPQGRGLAYRFALAGATVIIGSRDASRAQATADEINDRLGKPRATGMTNADAATKADMVLLAVPWDGHAEGSSVLSPPSLRTRSSSAASTRWASTRRAPTGWSWRNPRRRRRSGWCRPRRSWGHSHHVSAVTLWKTSEARCTTRTSSCVARTSVGEDGRHGPRRGP